MQIHEGTDRKSRFFDGWSQVNNTEVHRSISRAVLTRSAIYGMVIGGVAFASSSIAVGLATEDGTAVALVVSTLLVGLGVGMWAGAQPTGERDTRAARWIAASAFIAAAGSFSTFLDLYRNVVPGRGWLLAALFLCLAIPGYTLGMVAPELLRWARGLTDHTDQEEEDFADPLGELLVGVLAGLAFGVLLVGTVGLSQMSPGSLLVTAALLLIIGLILPEPKRSETRQATLYETVTPYGRLEVLEIEHRGERQPERRLYLNGEEESGQLVRSGAPTLAYVAAAERWLSSASPAGASYLFLGGGAYTLPRRISERDPRAQILVVELDPEVTRVAQRFFGLAGSGSIATVHGDARAYIDHPGDGRTFDRIYVDVYGGSEALPFSLITVEAAEAMRRRLNPAGVLAMNLIGRVVEEEQKRLWSTVRTFVSVFPQVALYVHLGRDYPDRQNLLLLASNDPEAPVAQKAGGFDLWPRSEWPEVGGTIIYHDISPAPPGAAGRQTPSSPRRQKLG